MADTKEKKKEAFYRGTGRRKSAVARVRVMEGTGQLSVNGRALEDHFSTEKDRGMVLGPLLVTDLRNRLDVIADVHGGGATGQAGAVSQGLARAIKEMFTGTPEGDGPPEEEQEAPPAPLVTPEGTEVTAEGQEGEEGEAEEPEKPQQGGLIRKLRDSGYLTRDSRMKERKKYGRKGARRSFQFSKR